MAAEIIYTSNPSDYLKLEGLYINEKDPPGQIVGVDLNRMGIAGKCVRGPETVQLITSPAEFTAIYGGRSYQPGAALFGEVWRALLGKKFGIVGIRRVVAAAAVAGARSLSNAVPTVIATATASSRGVWSLAVNGGPTVAVEAASNGDANMWNCRVAFQGTEKVYENLNTQAGFDNLLEVVGDDPANLIVLTKNADGRPVNSAATALTGGADGTLADADYIAAITDLAAYTGLAGAFVAEAAPSQSALNAAINTLAVGAVDRVFPVWSGVLANTRAQEITAKAAQITTSTDRVLWCSNPGYVLDPETGTLIDAPPHHFMGAILSQTDVDVHVGSAEASKFLGGCRKLRNENWSVGDYQLLKAAGISALEKVSAGFQFRSGVTASLVSGRTEIAARRMKDYLQISASERLKYYVKAKNTRVNRAQMAAELTAFCSDLKDSERIIESFSIDQTTVNTANQRAQGIEKILWRVRLIGHILSLVLETEIGTGVTIVSNEG